MEDRKVKAQTENRINKKQKKSVIILDVYLPRKTLRLLFKNQNVGICFDKRYV